MFELFPWSPMLETGIGIIDTQHRRLVELLNRLARMSVGESEPGAMDAVLDGLVAYAQEHFRTEEGVWAASLPADAELLTWHEGEHAGFCARVLAVRADLQTTGSDARLIRELLLFLSGWLAEHILQSDRRLALVLQGLARGASLADAIGDAHRVMSSGTGLMVQAALGMYRQLSAQTLELLQERQQREETLRAMATLKSERERQSLAVSLAGMLLLSDAGSLQQDLETLVRRVGETLGADRCVLRLYTVDRRRVDCRAEWCGPDVPPSQDSLGPLSDGPALAAWAAQLREQGEARIDDISRLPDWAQRLQPLLDLAGGGARAGAVCAVSLRHRGAFLGWLAVHMLGQPRRWDDDEVQWLQLLGSLLGSSLLRQRAEQQAHTLLDTIPAGVAAARITDRRLLFCNDSFCTLVGRSRQDLLGIDVAELHPPGELTRIEREFIALADNRAASLGTIEVCRPDGSRFLAEVRQIALALDGEPVVLAVFTDVTRRNAAEAALKASEQHLEQVVQARTLELARANRRLQCSGQRMHAMLELDRRLYLCSEPELLEAGVELALQLTDSRDGYLHFLSDDQRSIELCAWAPMTRVACALAQRSHFLLEQAGIWADALQLRQPVLHNELPVGAGTQGLPPGHVAVQRHLCVPVLEGEQVRMLLGVGNKAEPFDEGDVEQLQLVANDLWGLLLRHRAAAALAAARDAAVQASRAKSTFLASMSHEIRTPLNAVIGFAQRLGRDSSLGARQREQVQIIAHSGEHLLQLLNDVLDLSKIEAGQLRLLLVQFDPGLLLDEVARLHAPRVLERDLRFKVEGLGSLPTPLIGDAGKLRQILLNLLGNALKFTVQGGITLRAAAQPISTGGWSLRVEVSDTGPGISAEDQVRLFTPFQQGAAGERMGSGTGLGLSISRRLAALMGGVLELHSTLGQGSCFRLELPFRSGDAEPAQAVPSLADGATPPAPARCAEHEQVGELDPDLRAGMREAVRAGDMSRLRALIDGLDAGRPALAASLRALVQRYDYERLETLLR